MAIILTSTNFEAFVNLLSVLGFCGLDVESLIQAFKKTKGGKIVYKEKISGDQYQVQVNAGGVANFITLNGRTLDLLEDKKIQKGMNKIARVFKNPGISEIQFSGISGDTPPESISREEAEYFKAPEEEIEEIKTEEDIFLITRPDFEGRSKGWRCSFGYTEEGGQASNFLVTILDKEFLNNVKTGKIRISQGTKIRARYRKSIHEFERLNVGWEILEVLNIEFYKKRDKELSNFLQD